MKIRTANLSDLSAITALEKKCFPASLAASEKDFKARLQAYPNHFWLLEDNGELVGLIDGMVTNESTIRDAMYQDAHLHDEAGNWQAIFGVTVIPEHRKRGCAARLMKRVISDAKAQGRKGCILTCEARLIPYYKKFGYGNLGISKSVCGGVVWYDMRLVF